ncbi:DUF4872 domain-containing protein [Paenarthrobacter sp. PAE-2]|uniref:DUF4872 domain-containing protein n=1 Tax=Paenarthrobacter sp. PAE-2 TaxID=2982532 RepID=UPI002232A02D|nr:DUF4872 domain-containing protein [Paenarthrobacter sp. PAE-2]MCW3767573.1 DUF4872 domain-containing protein [Paenarthrobacter sp. PAE-2]
MATAKAGDFGVSGMNLWVERLRDTRTKKGWATLFADDHRRRQALTQVQEFLAGDEWSGSGALRPLYADFLGEAATGCGLPCEDVARKYQALGVVWDSFADSIDPNCPSESVRELFGSMASQLEYLATDEFAAAVLLRGAAEGTLPVRRGDREPSSRHANEGDQSAVGRL